MNSEILLGICMLLGIVGIQLAFRKFRMRRMKRHWERAAAACESGDFAGAGPALEKCVSLMPLWVPARALLGVVQARLGKLDKAEEHLKMVSELQPRHAEGHIELAVFYVNFQPGRSGDALAALARAVACDPEARKRIELDERLNGLRGADGFRALLAAPVASDA